MAIFYAGRVACPKLQPLRGPLVLTGPRQGKAFTVPIAQENMAEGARFENPEASETINLDLFLSFRSQSLTEESEPGEEPIKTDGTS